jgi:hypothetical protein
LEEVKTEPAGVVAAKRYPSCTATVLPDSV